MLESLKKNEAFEYQKLTPEEMKSRKILGRLVGPCADFLNPTRNGRGYGEELWEKVFSDPIVNEKIENKCLFGELGHPADREEVDMEKIALALNEKPKKNSDGKLIACFDILDTPNGRILKTLCDYGTTIGISSRGSGEVIGEEVDPDSYTFECFDAVITPAVKDARLSYVTESLDKNTLNLKKALCESLNSATEEERKVMKETLQELDINVEDNKKELKESFVMFHWGKVFATEEEAKDWIESNIKPENECSVEQSRKINALDDGTFGVLFYIGDLKDGAIDKLRAEVLSAPEDGSDVNPQDGEEHKSAESESPEQTVELEEANNDGSDEIIKSLQEALKEKSELEAQVKQLQEQLAVSDAKVGKLEENVGSYKTTTVKMSTLAVENKDLKAKVSTLEEELKANAKTIDSQKLRISKLVTEKKEGFKNEDKSLKESLTQKDAEIKTLNENFDEVKKGYEAQIKELTESIETLKSDSESHDKELNSKLTREERLKESYKKLAKKAADYYIESKATMLSVDADLIRSKLSNDYAVEEVDSICESLQEYELNMNKLPFSVDRKVKVKVSKSTNESLHPNPELDDDVDESLLRLAKLM